MSNELKLEAYMLIVQKDLHDLRRRISQAWIDKNTDPSIAAYQATEAAIGKHEAIIRDHLYEVTS
ncbi:MAG: hypothetical protein AAF412_04140 [Pseudomonadota bacterium]